MSDGIREVLDFWFDPSSKAHWFERDAAFDCAVRERLGDLHRRAAAGELDGWQASAQGCLALGDGRLVDVHVRRLRTKIESDAANPRHVATVRGLGYKLQG